jgi:hypothetical protein
MPACTFTSKRFLILASLLLAFGLGSAPSFAQDVDMSIPGSDVGGANVPPGSPQAVPQANAPAVPSGVKKEEPGLFDQAASPYLDYGDFNATEDEDADTLYFQYGRFFGLSLGLGYEAATGNRGYLYQPAFPRFDLKVHYWFDFQFAINLGIFFANHNFDYGGSNYQVKMIGYGMDLKYYFDVRNAAAALTFSNPFLIAGIGAINKNQTKGSSLTPTTDSTLSVSFGAGFEFPISYKKTYLILDGQYHTQSFADTITDSFNTRVPDLSGGFMTIMVSLLFCW